MCLSPLKVPTFSIWRKRRSISRMCKLGPTQCWKVYTMSSVSPSCTFLCYQRKILWVGSADPPQQSRLAWARMKRPLSDTSSLLAWQNSRNQCAQEIKQSKIQCLTLFFLNEKNFKSLTFGSFTSNVLQTALYSLSQGSCKVLRFFLKGWCF